jgi:hypothetical protein
VKKAPRHNRFCRLTSGPRSTVHATWKSLIDSLTSQNRSTQNAAPNSFATSTMTRGQ